MIEYEFGLYGNMIALIVRFQEKSGGPIGPIFFNAIQAREVAKELLEWADKADAIMPVHK